jgi:hypothetical protein
MVVAVVVVVVGGLWFEGREGGDVRGEFSARLLPACAVVWLAGGSQDSCSRPGRVGPGTAQAFAGSRTGGKQA